MPNRLRIFVYHITDIMEVKVAWKGGSKAKAVAPFSAVRCGSKGTGKNRLSEVCNIHNQIL